MANQIEVNDKVENREQINTTAQFNTVDLLKSAPKNSGGNDRIAATNNSSDSPLDFTNIYDGSHKPGGSSGRNGEGGQSAGDVNRAGGGSMAGDGKGDGDASDSATSGGGGRTGKTQDRIPSDGDLKASTLASPDKNAPVVDLSATTVRTKDNAPNPPAVAPESSLLLHR